MVVLLEIMISFLARAPIVKVKKFVLCVGEQPRLSGYSAWCASASRLSQSL